MNQEKKEALMETLTKQVGKEQAAQIVGGIEADIEANKGAETVINLPENFDERLDQAVAKAVEAKVKAEKEANKFKFTKDEKATKKLDKATKKLEAVSFIKHVYNEDYNAAASLSSVTTRAKALTTGATATAGVLVPELFESEIFSNFDTYSEIIGDARVRDYSGPGDVINLNQLDAKVVVYETSELGPTTASTPSYSAPSITYTKYTGEVVMSEELMEDKEADLMGNISEQFAEQYALEIQDRLVNRSTVGQEGLLVVSGVTTAAMGNGGSFANTTFDDYRKMQEVLMTQYNKTEGMNANFYVNAATWFASLKNITTSGSGFNQFAVNPFQGTPMSANGRPVRIVNEIATPTVTGSKVAIFADLNKHLVVSRKRGMRMKVNTTGTASDGRNLNTEDARQLVMNARIGHTIVLPAGIVTLVT